MDLGSFRGQVYFVSILGLVQSANLGMRVNPFALSAVHFFCPLRFLFSKRVYLRRGRVVDQLLKGRVTFYPQNGETENGKYPFNLPPNWPKSLVISGPDSE
jgi:hypothetical protein